MEGRRKNLVRLDAQWEESIEEIILRLPPAAVARFKCVSKGWLQRLSEPFFAERYLARNVSLLGFFHQIIDNAFQFTAISTNFRPEMSTGELSPAGVVFRGGFDHTKAVLNSSNGLILIYSTKPTPSYVVINPISGDNTAVRFPYNTGNIGERFMVFGFAFNSFRANPYFSIVEVTMAGRDYSWFQIHSYSSLSRIGWNTAYHEIPGHLRRNFVLSGPSTFYRDALHWLMEPSGVVAYHLFAKTFSYDLINVPGDKNYLCENGFCNCVKKMGDGGLYSSGHCSCRYLGENRGKLVYVRVTADRQFSLWTLVDYNRGVWCLTRVVAVDNLPESLFFGRVLAFDRVDSQLLFIRVKKKIFSYHYLSGDLKELCQIPKKYGGEGNCLGFVIPYELPRICFTIPDKTSSGTLPADAGAFHHIFNAISQLHLDPLGNEAALLGAISIMYRQLRLDPSAATEDRATYLRKNFTENLKGFQSRLKDDGHLHMYQQVGISQVAAKYFPHLQPTEVNTAGMPLWACYDFCVPFTIDGLRDTVINYNNFVRIEASLYGCTAEYEPLAGPNTA